MSEQNLRQEFEKSEHCEDLDFAWNDEFNCYADSTTQWIFQFWRDGYQVCSERNAEILDNQAKEFSIAINNEYEKIIKKEAIITQQAAELSALRGFANDVLNNLERINFYSLIEFAKKHRIIDENGYTTPLLTGE